MSRIVIVGAGSNLGAREAAIRAASDLLGSREGTSVRAVSPLYETDPLGPPQPRYLNAAYRLETDLSPPALLRIALQIERRLGRRRAASERWGPRSLDLDLLWDQRGPFDSPDLRMPHPELTGRSFALRPLLDVAPELADVYGGALGRLGPGPRPWSRQALVRSSRSRGSLEVEVEADSAAEACALSVAMPRPWGRPRSTRHAIVEATPEAFAGSVRAAIESGFAIHCTTISHCSQTQWVVQFHGVNLGTPIKADVRLWTTLGSKRKARVRFSVSPAAGQVVF
jgi:2-amino-4-hydroxy-6-hydroxymethyldihydropteridine diphosphokinase